MSSMTRRFYSEGQYGSGSAGATASSRDWGEKERAIEGQWARINDQQKLNMLRDTIEKQKIAQGEMRKDIEDLKEILELKKNQ
ncbi:hypothetical protein K492DRAFT_199256 [Lichtheimia hyalospora FSU 10163]|nr:hypothetical protein K492DRAFT_199256 [Lichtheimia hyalospora FSU 10163]